jgi:hypothetical protein
VSRACIEERIAGVVAGKRALFKGLFDGATDQLQFDRSNALGAMLERLVEEPAATGTAPEAPGEEASEDAPLGIDALPSGDEDQDASAPAEAPGGQPELAPALGPESAVTKSPNILKHADAAEVGRLLGSLTVERRADGAIHLTASPQAARALISLFEGMARLLDPPAASATPPPHTLTP